MGHRTKPVWNPDDQWIWSDQFAHPAIIEVETFEQAQAKLATKCAATPIVKPRRTPQPNLLRGMLFCGLCERGMQSQWLRDMSYYRCRFPDQYAIANRLAHHPTHPAGRRR